jgi:hypothetical protein
VWRRGFAAAGVGRAVRGVRQGRVCCEGAVTAPLPQDKMARGGSTGRICPRGSAAGAGPRVLLRKADGFSRNDGNCRAGLAMTEASFLAVEATFLEAGSFQEGFCAAGGWWGFCSKGSVGGGVRCGR